MASATKAAAARANSVASELRVNIAGIEVGTDIDIVPASAAPAVAVAEPDGVDDTANTSFTIQYTATDGDDDLGGSSGAAYLFKGPLPTGRFSATEIAYVRYLHEKNYTDPGSSTVMGIAGAFIDITPGR